MNVEKIRKIEAHGRDLLAIFPNATERDPLALCKKLRRLENQAARIALRLCNGPEYPHEDDADKALDAIMEKVVALLGPVAPWPPIFINRDPRGYQLKISDEWMRANKVKLHTDWGGYGILAPEIE